MGNDWDTTEMGTERERMENIAWISRMITASCLILCYIVNVTYALLRLIFMKHSDNKLFFRGYFPYDVTVSPNYELTMIGQVLAMACSATVYSTVDTYITTLILHICGQLSNLKDDLRNIHSYDKNELRMKLKKIVQKHDYINKFVFTRKLLTPTIFYIFYYPPNV